MRNKAKKQTQNFIEQQLNAYLQADGFANQSQFSGGLATGPPPAEIMGRLQPGFVRVARKADRMSWRFRSACPTARRGRTRGGSSSREWDAR